MLNLPPSTKIYLCTTPADMRRSFDGLSGMVKEVIGADPFSGHLFVFRNKRGDRTKILYWDSSGFCLFYKRLELGVFHFRMDEGRSHCEVSATDLQLILEGIDLSSARRHRRYRRA